MIQIIVDSLFPPMQIENLDKRQILKKFRQNGHHLSPGSLNDVLEYLCSQQQENLGNKLNQLIEKINKISILSTDQINETLVKSVIVSSQFSQDFLSIDDIVNQKFKESIFPITPYEFVTKQICIQKPPKSLFQFTPVGRTKMFYRRLERAQQNIKKSIQKTIIGIIYEKVNIGSKSNQVVLYSQGLSAEIKLDITQMKQHCPFILNGCMYQIKGEQKGKDLVFRVQSINNLSPISLPYTFNNHKFKQTYKMSGVSIQNLRNSQTIKTKLRSYGISWSQQSNDQAVLVIGNITLSVQSITNVKFILKMLNKVKCVILMLSKSKHSQLDLSFDDKLVYVIPDSDEAGPSTLPRIPVFKYNFKGATILPNPCKVSFFGDIVTFFNFSMNSHLHSKNIIKVNEMQSSQKLKNVGQFLFGQGNLSLDLQTYWQQQQYMDINSNEILMLSDETCPQGQIKLNKGGHISSIGHFDRESSFTLYFPLLKDHNKIQPSKL